MIIYASQSFVKRLGCSISRPHQKPVHGQAMDGWSDNILKVFRVGEVAVCVSLLASTKGTAIFNADK